MDYQVEGSEVTHEGHFSTVVVDQVRMPDGEVHRREIIRHRSAVAALALDEEGNVILLRQYRHALREKMLEIPAGILDIEGEQPADAARRELIEETGLDADRWQELLCFANSAGWTDETTTIYLAQGLSEVDKPDSFTAEAEEADLEILRLPLPEAVERIDRGEITDAKTVIGILLAARRLA